MTTITLAIEDEVFAKLKLAAVERNTTVDDLVREALSKYAPREDRQEEARKALLELMDKSTGRMAPDYKFDRGELYDR
jgi:predicted transcriptional regulator